MASKETLADEDEEKAEGKQGKYSHPVYKQLAEMNGRVNNYPKSELVRHLKTLRLESEGSKGVLAKRLKNFYKKTMLSINGVDRNGSSKIHVMFDYYIVIDFEATCQHIRLPEFKQEIIEFPAVLINCHKCEIVDEFRYYCRPVKNPILTEFCTELTGITQDDVDAAPLFHEVLALFEEWLEKWKLGRKHSYAIITDGPWDIGKFLKDQCLMSKIEFPTYCLYWINIRKSFANYYDTAKVPLSTMIQLIGLEFQGRAHSGLDDARNIAAIALRLLKDGARLILNEKLAIEGQKRREDGELLFAIPVHAGEFKSIQNQLRPNYPQRKANKI